MGSGSYGGGGGGGGGWAGGGGGYTFKGGEVVTKAASAKKIEAAAFETLCKLPKEYLLKQFGSPLIEEAYKKLFDLSLQIFVNHDWAGVSSRYGVDDGPGCLVRWVEAVVAESAHAEPDVRVRETALSCLEDFLIVALNYDIDVFYSGTADEVMAKIDEKVFKSTSGYFLGHLIWRILERERNATPESVEFQIKEVAQKTADKIIADFEGKYHGKDQVTHQQLFSIIRSQSDWFRKLICP